MMEPWDGPASILFSDGDTNGRSTWIAMVCDRRATILRMTARLDFGI